MNAYYINTTRVSKCVSISRSLNYVTIARLGVYQKRAARARDSGTDVKVAVEIYFLDRVSADKKDRGACEGRVARGGEAAGGRNKRSLKANLP